MHYSYEEGPSAVWSVQGDGSFTKVGVKTDRACEILFASGDDFNAPVLEETMQQLVTALNDALGRSFEDPTLVGLRLQTFLGVLQGLKLGMDSTSSMQALIEAVNFAALEAFLEPASPS